MMASMMTITPNDNEIDANDNAQRKSVDNSDKQIMHPSTPSPQCVDELYHSSEAITSANRSAIVSKMLSDHLVTVNDDEVIVSSTTLTLPELEEATTATILVEEEKSELVATSTAVNENNDRRRSSNHDMPTFTSGTNTSSPLISTPKSNTNIPLSPSSPMSASSPASSSNNNMINIQHKLLYQCVSSFASPLRPTQDPQLLSNLLLKVGQEREVLFHTDSLGIKLSRHADGYVRVLSVTPYRAATNYHHHGGSFGGNNDQEQQQQRFRTGEIYTGDVVREVCGVDLRHPIDSAVWKMTVGLMKMAPRPLQFVVARELPKNDMEEEMESKNSSISSKIIDNRYGPTREVHFLESCLGVKLHHSSEGYVQILSVTPYKSFPNSPLARIGEVYAGDIVLLVGGVWDLREPIDDTTWGVLIKFIRETRRPLSMVVTDGDCLEPIIEQKEGENCEEEENEQATPGASVETKITTTCCAEEPNQDYHSNEDKEGSDSKRSYANDDLDN